MIHTHAFRFQNMPNLGIPFVYVKYEWDFLHTAYPAALTPIPIPDPGGDVYNITKEHVRYQVSTVPTRERCSIDLEPGVATPNFLLNRFLYHTNPETACQEWLRLRSLAAGLSTTEGLGRRCSWYGQPFHKDYFIDSTDYNRNANDIEVATALGMGIHKGLSYTSFDYYYWESQVSYAQWVAGLDANFAQARRFGLPLQVWFSPFDVGTGKEIPFATLGVMVEELIKRMGGRDELLWWRGMDSDGHNDFEVEWTEAWEWVANVFRLYVPPV